jgi:hypothetical protein
MKRMGRIKASIEIVKASWGVIKADKELLLFPVLSFISLGVMLALFSGGILLTTTTDANGEIQMSIAGWVLGAFAYFVLAFIAIFFNAALVSAAHQRLAGDDPTIESGLAGATSRIGKILQWAAVSATVSIILKAIQERLGFVGQIVIGLIGVAWGLVTFLVIPVIVIENLGVVDAVKRSGSLFKSAWGEQVVGNAAIGLIGFLAVLVAVPIAVLGVMSGVAAVAIGSIALVVLWAVLVAALTNAMSGIFSTALYIYAADGKVPSGFTQENFDHAFKQKPQSGTNKMFNRS